MAKATLERILPANRGRMMTRMKTIWACWWMERMTRPWNTSRLEALAF
jgi:hypothetical protein